MKKIYFLALVSVYFIFPLIAEAKVTRKPSNAADAASVLNCTIEKKREG